MARLKVAVLVSGRGSNLQALLAACRDPAMPAEIVLVISNRPGAGGLAHAAAAGVATAVIDHRAFPDRAAFDAALDARLRAAGVGLVCLAGFMRLLTAGFIESWRDRLVNIHPSLLPAFPGLDTHARALAAGVRFAGCTVHLVRFETDTGPILVQAAVPVRPEDDADSLAARVLAEEHRIYPMALRWLAEGRVRVAGERAVIAGAAAPPAAAICPADRA
ncbi:MAG: phosphoribosylglycinamide formyltransferase [Dongiaceae bacterium]